ncbi:hypothetical protein [Streptomyces noursei]|uniref:hypothetical protein n=1 Tax=Streptomyces noursei TaxID=1971 RepID=UPI0038266BAC
MYTIKYNRTTNHIDGLSIRTTSTGEEAGGVVAYCAENACGALTRHRFATGEEFETVIAALHAAREGGRKLCKTCEKVAEAMIAAEAVARTNSGHDTAFERARALGYDCDESHDYAAAAAKAPTSVAEVTVKVDTAQAAKGDNDEGKKMATVVEGPVYSMVGKELHAAFPGAEETLCGETGTGPIPADMVNSVESAPMCNDCASVSDAWHDTHTQGDEMPPRKRAAGKPKEDIADAIARVKDLTVQVLAIAEAGEDSGRAKELADQAETVIAGLPTSERTDLRAALEAAKRGESDPGKKKRTAKKAATPAKKAAAPPASKETQDYKSAIPDAEKVVADVAAAYAAGVDAEKANATSARTIAEKVLAARLFLSDRDGHPDFHGRSHAAKTIAGDIYAAAGKAKGFERNEENEDALDRLVKSVQNIRQDVLVKYVRNITKEDAEKHFPLALKADPKADPATAIQTFYKIPAQSAWEIQSEKRRLERAASKALAAGKEKEAKELESAAKAVGKEAPEGGEAATPGAQRQRKHFDAIEAAAKKLGGVEADLKKISADEAADLIEKLETFMGQAATLVTMLKGKK